MFGNKITVAGNLTGDPILKYLPTGKAVINFTVACNHSRYDRETQSWVDSEPTYFKVDCWDTLAENISESLRRGDPVVVVGRMLCRTYQQEGKTRESWELKADTVAADLRRRAASLRRVLRSSPQCEPDSGLAAHDHHEQPDIEQPDLEEPDMEDVEDVQYAQSLTAAPGLAVAG